jgi:hypothetical protein
MKMTKMAPFYVIILIVILLTTSIQVAFAEDPVPVEKKMLTFEFYNNVLVDDVMTRTEVSASKNFELSGDSSYDIEIPADPNDVSGNNMDSWLHIAVLPAANVEGVSNLVVDTAIKDFVTNGGAGEDYAFMYTPEGTTKNGTACMKLEVTFLDNTTEMITLNLFQPKFKGVRCTPDVSAGDWGESSSYFCGDADYYGSAMVYVGTRSVTLSLPNISTNDVNSFYDITSPQADVVITPIADKANMYNVTLSNNASAVTQLNFSTINESGAEPKMASLSISKQALSFFDGLEDDGSFVTNVRYTMDDSFEFTNPKLLVVYWHYIGTDGTRKALYSKTFDLPVFHTGDDPVYLLRLLDGNKNNDEDDKPNELSLFLVSGPMTANAHAFGGVKFGGSGYDSNLPNNPMNH